MMLTIVAVALLSLGSVHGYGSGAPSEACDDMVPQHHTPPQTSKIPYTLSITPSKNIVRPGEKITIKIAPKDNLDFQGFMVQARVGDSPVGKFLRGKDYKIINCGKAIENAVTHSSPTKKSEVVIQWMAPPNLSESVTFYATVAKNGGEFWVKQPLKTITVKK